MYPLHRHFGEQLPHNTPLRVDEGCFNDDSLTYTISSPQHGVVAKMTVYRTTLGGPPTMPPDFAHRMVEAYNKVESGGKSCC